MKLGDHSVDIQAVLAVTWLLASIGATVALSGLLGGRGWLWLAINHLFCFIGCSHEYWRYRQREQLRRSST